jgi:tRNA-specific 2-thiouridylase
LVERVRGLSVLDAAAVSETDLTAALPGAAGRPESAALAVDALHGAITCIVESGAALSPCDGPPQTEGVLVGMSGGVDSSVAALLLRRQGYRVVGATLELWREAGEGGARSCCSPETVRRARRVAHGMGLPHLTVDARRDFSHRVVQYFIESYAGGVTPNPCAKCNARVRFGALLEVAERAGLRWVGTGHYARMIGSPPRLARGADRRKDQSYVLAEVDPHLLERVLLPLGEMEKAQVRSLAAEAGLEGHRAPESQEICFVPDDDHRRFLRAYLGERPGAIVDASGRRLGSHSGTYNYTVGQRRGLGISSSVPLYVLRVDPSRQEVVVGSKGALYVDRVMVEGLTWHSPEAAVVGSTAGGAPPLEVQLRSSGRSFPVVKVEAARLADSGASCERMVLHLRTPAYGVATGQTAVVYYDDLVCVAGTIVETGGGLAGDAVAGNDEDPVL